MLCRKRLLFPWFVSLCAWLPAAALAAPPAPAEGRPLQQMAGILEYVAGDYRQAVSEDGRVLEPGEYAEQRSLAAESLALADQAALAASDPLRAQLASITRALSDKRPPSIVAELCREARRLLVEQHGVRLSPATPPSQELGAQLYVSQGCPTCHGADGRADTEAAKKLTPRPANFLDPERMAAVSPYRAFHAISFGLSGTAMRGFPQLRDSERFSLAFYVLSLRYAHADFERGKRVLERSSAELPRSAAGLALLSDEDILRALGGTGTPDDREAALAYLRARAPFAPEPVHDGRNLAEAHRALADGLAAYRRGDRAAARRAFVAAYLDGFEPREAALAVHDAALVHEVEAAMLALRQAVADGQSETRVAGLVARAGGLLNRAEGSGADGTTAMLGALTIALREGFEIALLLSALLALVRKRGLPELARYVHAGWMLAAVLGLATFWAVGEVLSGLQRELAEGIATLVAAVVLLGVTHWLLGQVSSQRFFGFVAERMGKAANNRTALGILGLSFIATYREAFEIVLFFKALLLDAGAKTGRVFLGAGLGLAVLGASALVLRRIGQRLKPRPFMLGSSIVLALLVLSMTGNGVHSLQEAAVLPITVLAFPELPALGVHPSAETLGAQGCVLLFLLGSAVWPTWQRHRANGPQPAE